MMGMTTLRSLLLAAFVLSNISTTTSRHQFRHNAHGTRHRRQDAGLYHPASYVIPGGEGTGAWGEWERVSPCSRTCGGGVANQKRICLQVGPDDEPLCTGGDTKYFSCQTQDCPENAGDFRAEQCSEYNDQPYMDSGVKYNWVPYTKGPFPCELNCMPRGERFYYPMKAQVVDGTRCDDESFNVCVAGVCQPVGCDMMLGSNAREDQCRVCRGNGTNCNTIEGLLDTNDLTLGYNDMLLIPQGATNIFVEEVQASNNYLALRSKAQDVYYLNGRYEIDPPKSFTINGSLWHYERSFQGLAAPDKLRCIGPTPEPLYLSLLLQEINVGISYKYSVPSASAPPLNQQYNWVHKSFSECSATCGGGFQVREVTCRSRDELDPVPDTLCDDGLKPSTNQTCNIEDCPPRWVEGPWSPCSRPCGDDGKRSRQVYCEKMITNRETFRFPSIVADEECFDLLGPKPKSEETCNQNATCPTWFTGPWKPCNRLCGEGKQTRQVVCHQRINGFVQLFEDRDCDGEKPITAKACLLHPCDGVDWVISEWSGCDTCLSTVRTRVAHCATKDHQVIDPNLCSYHPTPVLKEECDRTKLPPCQVQWYATQWSNCSVECGTGVRTRRVFCGLFDGASVIKVDDERCDEEYKYNDTTECVVPKEKCPAKWFAGPWSECTKKCGGGEQFRRVMCLFGKEVLECDNETVLHSTQSCNIGPCDKDDLLPIDSKSIPVYNDYDEEDCVEEEEEYPEVGAEEYTTAEPTLFPEFIYSPVPTAADKISEDTGSGYELIESDQTSTTDVTGSTETTVSYSTETIYSFSETEVSDSSTENVELSTESTTPSTSEISVSSTTENINSVSTEIIKSSTTDGTSSSITESTEPTTEINELITKNATPITSESSVSSTTEKDESSIKEDAVSSTTDSAITSSTESIETISTKIIDSSTIDSTSSSLTKVTNSTTDNEEFNTSENGSTTSENESSTAENIHYSTSSSESSITDITSTIKILSSSVTDVSSSIETTENDLSSTTKIPVSDTTENDESTTESTDSSTILSTLYSTQESSEFSSTKITDSTITDKDAFSTTESDLYTTTENGVSSTIERDTLSTIGDILKHTTDYDLSSTTNAIPSTSESSISSITENGASTTSESDISITTETALLSTTDNGASITTETSEGSTDSATTESSTTYSTESSTTESDGTGTTGSTETAETGESTTSPGSTDGTTAESSTIYSTESSTTESDGTGTTGSTETTETRESSTSPGSTDGTTAESSTIYSTESSTTESDGTGTTGSTEITETRESSTSPGSTDGTTAESSTIYSTESSTTESDGTGATRSTETTETEESSTSPGSTDGTTTKSSTIYSTESSTTESDGTGTTGSTETTETRESSTSPGSTDGTTAESSTVYSTESSTTESDGTGTTGSTETTETEESSTSPGSTESTTAESSTIYSTESTESDGTGTTGSTETTETGESSTSPGTTDASTSSEETTNESSVTETTPWDWASTVEVLINKPRCKPRKTAKCTRSKFGCCPDKRTPAAGPFDEGCPNPETCKDSKNGCCPDGVSPAAGPLGKGCPVSPCNETLYGCCSDNVTASEGNNHEGCPPPPPACVSSKHGCCGDNDTFANGPEKQGCPETGIYRESTETPTPVVDEGCATSEFGCCFDNETDASGPNGEGCPCSVSEFGCCPDGLTTASGNQMEGCLMSCNTSAYGCCPDGETPAHGPQSEGCCLLHEFGCCPDNYRPAKGPDHEGCGCEYASFGCCPDNITIARGRNMEGCGCEHSRYGCCPDRHTEAQGSEFQGCECHTHQFGCCLDGVTIASGPGLEGCRCERSKYGCCGDETTSAKGPNMAGCDCSSSKYGCCPDGITEAEGDNFQNCSNVPVNKQAACALDSDKGPCRNYTKFWYYDMQYGGCAKFWYGGCEGNGNRFVNKEECEDVCVQPSPKDSCNLPQVKASCNGYNIRWYYNSERKQCSQFVYGGCLGNSNNFDTKEICQERCEPEKTEDQCNLELERGPCAGNFIRWGFSAERRRCEQFVWGGCGGNHNRYDSEAACQLQCAPHGKPQQACSLPQDAGNCTEKHPVWSFNQAENRCVPFYYSGCGGNDNRFNTEHSCVDSCPSAYVQEICTLPAMVGDCDVYTQKWFYDTTIKRCRQFYYGGCGGNENNFLSESECENRCSEQPTTTTTVKPDSLQPQTEPAIIREKPEFCLLDIDKGPCTQSLTHWAHDAASGTCVQFQYGGCGGNLNNFYTFEYCQQYCGSSISPQDVCQLPFETGPCDQSIMKWFYNAASKSCNQFTYGGCEGNGNRFDTEAECERQCKQEVTTTFIPISLTTTITMAPTTSTDLIEPECATPLSLTPCGENITVYYFDTRTQACLVGDFGACRYSNSYRSEEECQRRCGAFRQLDVCGSPLDTGPCTNAIPKFYWDPLSGRCLGFAYGGCHGGPNRFSTEDECEEICGTTRPGARCLAAVSSGTPGCGTPSRRWYYSAVSGECIAFVYSGCGGNDNNFHTYKECVLCKRPSLPTSETDLGNEVLSDCDVYNAECAALKCDYGVQRTRSSDSGCERCKCNDHPCANKQCSSGERCVMIPYRDPITYDITYSSDCGIVNKSGSCPPIAVTVSSTENRCRFQCNDDADCPGAGKCCERDCSKLCLDPAVATSLPPTITTYEPELPQVPSVNSATEQEVHASLGGTATLRCLFHGNPPPKITWQRGQITIEGDVGRYRLLSDGALEIVYVFRNDSGVYICIADNGLGVARQEVNLQVDDSETGNEVLPDCDFYNAECAALHCDYGVQRSRSSSGCERCKCIDHPCANKICSSGERCVVTSYRDPITLDVIYSSECGIANKSGSCPSNVPSVSVPSIESRCRLQCNDDADCSGAGKCCERGCSKLCLEPVIATSPAPTITTYVPELPQVPSVNSATEQEVHASLGGTATLRCLFHGNPPPKITWQRGQITIEGDVGRYRLLSDGALEIVSVFRNDSGVYICIADNGLGVARQEVNLQVDELETGNEVLPDCDFYNEECAALHCDYGVQRSRSSSGCERCKCNDHPCANKICSSGERCVVIPYRDPISLDVIYSSDCGIANKSGSCPWNIMSVSSMSDQVRCRHQCNDDADCPGAGKCCERDCSKLCLEPVIATSPAPTITTYAPELNQVPSANFATEREVHASLGGMATLRCLFHGNPPPKITWKRRHLTIESDVGRYRLLSDGALEIVSVFRNDSGVYICIADNGLGVARQEVNLQVDDGVEGPAGIAGLSDAVVVGELGQPLSVRCMAYGNPPPSIYWYHGRKGPMVPFSNVQYEARDNVLHIKKLSIDTLGEYVCLAYNTFGKPVDWSITIKAYRIDDIDNSLFLVTRQNEIVTTTRQPQTEATTTIAPEIEIPVYTVPVRTRIVTEQTRLAADSELSLLCEVDGYPIPDVYWTKDSVPISSDDRITVTEFRLTVSRTNTNDTGVYGCHAFNAFNSHYSSVQINIEGLYIPPTCNDNPLFANCALIVRSKFCVHKYYSNFCCKSCVEAGQLDVHNLQLQAGNTLYRK